MVDFRTRNGDYAEKMWNASKSGNKRSWSQLERRYRLHALVTLQGLGLVELVREGFQETPHFREIAGDSIDYFEPKAIRRGDVGPRQGPAFEHIILSAGGYDFIDPREFPYMLGYMNSVIGGELKMPTTEYYTAWGGYNTDVLEGKFRMGKK